MNKFFDYLFRHQNLLLAAIWSYVGHLFSDETYLRVRFRLLMGKWPDLKNPKTFSEKLQWLKIHNRKPEYTTMVDKLAVKDYVSGIIGEEYVIPSIGVWDRPEDIDWDKLPNQFVLKTTHGGGSLGVVVCKDKNTFDKNKAIAKLRASMKDDGFRVQGEWPYKNVPRRILAEKYIEPSPKTNDLPDYKFFCFNGEPKFCQVISGRNETMCIDFFDNNWQHQSFHEPSDYPFAKNEPARPCCLELMWDLSKKLAKNKPFSRIDFYEVNNRVYFGEITFYPTGGFGGFDPEEWDYKFGEWIELPENKITD